MTGSSSPSAPSGPPSPGWLETLGAAVADATVAPDAVAYGPGAIRLGAALVLGGLIGFERERRHRPAGLRTHMLVSVAAALFTAMALEIAAAGDRLGPDLRVDPTRVIEAVTAGVAFLAAGAIIRDGRSVRGLTTGAGLWLAGAVGMTCGLGYLGVAATTTVAAVIVLAVIRRLEP
jgi:putative Mg2+ transporter-C (MgtC) family protein